MSLDRPVPFVHSIVVGTAEMPVARCEPGAVSPERRMASPRPPPQRRSRGRAGSGRSRPAADPIFERACESVAAATEKDGLARALEVGRALVPLLYEGDPGAFRGRATKSISLRRLAADPRVPISAAALYRLLVVHEVWHEVDGERWPDLTAAHFRSVDGLKPQEQRAWLARAHARRLSASRLRRELSAAGFASASSERGGRLPVGDVGRLVVRLERALASAQPVSCRSMHPAVASATAIRLEQVVVSCRRIAARLRARAKEDA